MRALQRKLATNVAGTMRVTITSVVLLAITLWCLPARAGDKADPFADRVVGYEIGPGGGFGEERLPDIVLGAPHGGGKLKSSDHVFSLGNGGSITLEFVDNEIVDGPGADFIVFENPFLQAPGNDPELGFFELGKVEISADGVEWFEIPYDTGTRVGCAGHHPVLANPDEEEIDPTDPDEAGGDAFDIKASGLKVVRFVRITDLANGGGEKGTAGFDLDAVAAIHSRARANEKK